MYWTALKCAQTIEMKQETNNRTNKLNKKKIKKEKLMF